MADNHRKSMQIPKEYLEEKNYEGTRLVEVTDPKVLKLKAELRKFHPSENAEVKAHLDKMEEVSVILDPFFTQIRELDAKKEELKKEMQPTKDIFDAELKAMEAVEQKAELIKQKIQPLVNKIVESELGEFEKAMQLIEKDGKLFIEIADEIEEKIKLIRTNKLKK